MRQFNSKLILGLSASSFTPDNFKKYAAITKQAQIADATPNVTSNAKQFPGIKQFAKDMTLIDATTGFVGAAAGDVRLDGRPILHKNATWRARRGLRRSFQSLELFEDVTVAENLHAGADHATRLSWLTDLVVPGRHPLPPTAVTAVRQFGLEEHLTKRPGELPYGLRRLVGIARAVASGPSVLMLDEPAAGLDTAETAELAALIRQLADERGMAILLVEHDVGLVISICDRAVVLDFGRVIASGTAAEVRADPVVHAAYLGEPIEVEAGAPVPQG